MKGTSLQDREPSYKDYAIQAAKDLYYGKDTIEAIENAKSNSEIRGILETARKRMK